MGFRDVILLKIRIPISKKQFHRLAKNRRKVQAIKKDPRIDKTIIRILKHY